MDPLLEGYEVEPAVTPHHELAVEHDIDVQRTHRRCDLGEVPGETSLLARLQPHPSTTGEGDTPEAVKFGLVAPLS
ncbi:MAG TPA: hypothetical protein VE709_13525 [Pseudonocardiaceae bacterium]|nr:hypothetical protein [Pseudonocardiaceae bacterium]